MGMVIFMKPKKNKTMQMILYRSMSIVNFFIFILILIALCIVIFSNSIKQIKNSRLELLEQIAERNKIINNVVIYMADEIHDNLGDELLKCQAKDYENLTKKIDNTLQENSKMLRKIQMEPTVITIMREGYVYHSEGETQENIDIIKNTMWYINNFTNDEDVFWTVRFNAENNEVNMKLSYGKILRDSNRRYEGIIITSITEKTLNNIYADVLDEENQMYILDKSGKAISHSIQSLVGSNLYYMPAFLNNYGKKSSTLVNRNSKDVLLSNYYDEETGWTIVEEKSVVSLVRSYFDIIIIAIVLLIFSTITSLVTLYYTSRRISKPMTDITNQMILSSENEFNKISIRNEYREVYILSNIYNMTIDKMNKLIEKIKVEEKSKRKLELAFLQAQINPHFLHNTLFSIKCLIEMNKYQRANIMLSNLMKTLKIPIESSKEWINISEEIEYLRNYIYLMENRYDDRKIEFIIDIDDHLKNLCIPRLMLQPIVENAIFHGFEKMTVNPILNIHIYEIQGNVIIRICDNGEGMTNEEINNLWNNSYKSNKTFHKISLINVRDRIELLFGEQYGITVISEPQKGTEVILKLRKVTQEEIDGTNFDS